MGKIGDLWVKLGFKNSEFKQGIDESKQKTSDFGETVKGVKGKVVAAFALITGAVIGTIKTMESLSDTNQRMSDSWGAMVSGMKAQWEEFKTSLANTDFEGLGQRMRNAYDAASSYYDTKDWNFEVENAAKLLEADYSVELETNLEKARNIGLADKERLAAIERIKQIYSEINNMKVSQYGEVATASLNAYITKATGASKVTQGMRDSWQKFLVWMGQNATGVAKETSDYANKLKDYRSESKRTGAITGPGADMRGQYLDAQKKSLDETLDRLHKLGVTDDYITKMYNYNIRTNDAATNQLIDDILRWKYSLSAVQEETRRISTLENSIKAKKGSTGAVSTGSAKPRKAKYSSSDFFEDGATAIDPSSFLNSVSQLQMPDIITDDYLQRQKEKGQKLIDQQQEIADMSQRIAEEFSNAIAYGFADGISTLTDSLFGLQKMNGGAIVSALLSPLADACVTAGILIMTSGEAVEALKDTFATGLASGGMASIAAGAALVVVGAAAKSGLAAIAKGGNSTSANSSYSGNSSASSKQTIKTEMTVYVKGRISGSDIVLSGQKTLTNWSR